MVCTSGCLSVSNLASTRAVVQWEHYLSSTEKRLHPAR